MFKDKQGDQCARAAGGERKSTEIKDQEGSNVQTT